MAARRLAQWVADEIAYEIPGGISARGTYDIRAGECGAHSLLLAAFCRAVGIPARVVWGCMYTNTLGASFGQHGWTEIYMGEGRWIPVDSTAYEADFVDSGHIRLGVFESSGVSLNARSMEILDYRVGSAEVGEARPEAPAELAPYVGTYASGPGRVFDVTVQDGHLSVAVQGSMVIPLGDPDARGHFPARRMAFLSFAFARDDAGRVVKLILQQTRRMRRRSEPDSIGDDVPVALRRLLGGYLLPGAGEFRRRLVRRGAGDPDSDGRLDQSAEGRRRRRVDLGPQRQPDFVRVRRRRRGHRPDPRDRGRCCPGSTSSERLEPSFTARSSRSRAPWRHAPDRASSSSRARLASSSG